MFQCDTEVRPALARFSGRIVFNAWFWPRIVIVLFAASVITEAAILVSAVIVAETKFVSRVREKVDEFRLHDFRGTERSPGEYQNRKFLVVS